MSEQLQVRVGRAARGDVRWRATSALPPGLSLTPRGRLHGEPTGAGTTEVGYVVHNDADASLSRPSTGRVLVTVDADLGSRVTSGGRHACSVRTDGTLWCWGANFEGQLGLGDTAGRRKPTQVGSGRDWAPVSGGGMHTCATRTNGTLWCWGLNYRGQLGLGGRADKLTPRKVGDDRDWATVSAGWVHTCATKADGSGWCWGNNAYGQLGIGSTDSRYEPRQVAADATWTDLRAGGWSTCGVRRDGSAWCWGRNTNGELGLGDTGMRWLPNRIGDAVDWAALRPAWTHTCGLRTSGAAQCWGNNAQRQLGTGAGASSRSPATVAGGHVFSAISTGTGFSCGTDTDGVLWCWGNGRYGQIGTGAATAREPVRVSGEGASGGFVGVESGWLHSCAVRASSAPYCWGENETGALGDGEALDRSTPGPVSYAAGRRDAVDRTRTRPVDPVLGARPTGDAARATGRSARRADPYELNVVSLNILGSNHSAPRKDAGRYSPARVRSEWVLDHLAKVSADIVGFQEIQRDQLGWFLRGAGETYDVWPGTEVRGGLQTTIAWRQDTWAMTAHDTVDIPFITQTRAMPLVRLQHRASGRSLWVMNVHNAPRDLQAQRNRAVNLEIDRLAKVVGQGEPVLLIGDFNERGRVYCEVARRLDMVAPRGGSLTNGQCRPPSKGKVRVDWIFGTQDAAYSRYREDRSPLVKRITDHAVLRTHVSVP